MTEKKTISKNVAIILGVAITVITLVAFLFAFGFIPKNNISTESNSNTNQAGKLADLSIMTSDSGGECMFTGTVTNVGNENVYDAKLHVIGTYPNGIKVIDTYITIGNQGVITAHTVQTVDSGFLFYTYHADSGTPILVVTPEWSNSPSVASLSGVTPTPTPNTESTMRRFLINQNFMVENGGTLFRINLICSNTSPPDITFSSNNILYNGMLGKNYGNFAPKLVDSYGANISQVTISDRVFGNAFIGIILPQGAGSPWVSGATVDIAIQTDTAQGSITVTLP